MKNRWGLLAELVANFLLPWLIFHYASPHYGELNALGLSVIPPVVWAVIGLIRTRRVDALSAIVVLGIGLSIVMVLLGGSGRILLVRESFVSGLIGLMFLGSLALNRPAVFFLARATLAREGTDAGARFEAIWTAEPSVRQAIGLITLVWGLGLVGEAALRSSMAWYLPIETCLLVSPLVGYGVFGGLTLWTVLYRKRLRANRLAQGESASTGD